MEDNDGLYGMFFRALGLEYVKNPGRIPYSRQRPDRLKHLTESEKENHELYYTLKDWLEPLKDYVEVGFRNHPSKDEPMVAALRNLLRQAVIRNQYGREFLPNLADISTGDLVIEDTFQVYFDYESSEVKVTWDPELPPTPDGKKAASDDDRLMILVYRTFGWDAYGKVYGARRSEGIERVTIPPGEDPLNYYLFVAFTSADGTSQSRTVAVDPCLWEGVTW